MTEYREFNNEFNPLNCNDDDVLSFPNNQLFKISQFYDNLRINLESQVRTWFTQRNSGKNQDNRRLIDYTNLGITGLGSSLGNVKIQWVFPQEGQNCEILRLGSKHWQKGKLRIQANLEIFPNKNDSEKKSITQFILEFCPDEPEVEEILEINESDIPQPESPLDDLRQRINQDNQSDNQ
ncbi:MAG: KGK domain-containing protein [Coleofasciculus chthonoplastes F3-SA18-01]|uniref:KGK domain-containing protein n=1 Tax=Coleofasciculus chthonoplastes TaxID=64178 RepID=UPI0032F98E77